MAERSDPPAPPAHDAEAFWALVEPHDRALRALAYRLVGDRAAMDDVLQEAYLRAFRSRGSLRGQEAVGAWLYRIVYNASMDHLRRARKIAPLADVLDRPDPAPDPADVAAGRQDLRTALASLPPDMRAAVLLVDAEGHSYEEAGEIIGVPKGTVASRLSRARGILRRALGSHTEGANGR